MKKLYFMLVAMLMAFSANAAMYLHTNYFNSNWSEVKTMTENGSTYTYTIEGASKGDIYFIISKSESTDWNVFRSGHNFYYTGGADDDYVVTANQRFEVSTYEKGSKAMKISVSEKSDVEFKLETGSENYMTVTVTPVGSTTDPTPDPVVGDFYLTGKFNEWALADANYKFTKNGTAYTLTLASLNGQFKIKDGQDWSKSTSFGGDTGGEDVPTVAAVIGDNTLWDGSSVNLVADNWKNVTLSFTYDGTQKSITLNVSEGTTPDPGTEEPNAGDFYLTGAFNKWDIADADYKFTKNGTTYTLTLTSLDGQFKIKDGQGWSESTSFGGDSGLEDVEFVDAVIGNNTLWVGSSVNLKADNWKNVTLTFTYDGSQESITLNVSTAGTTPGTGETPVVELPEQLYIIGNVNGYAWATDKGVKLTHEAGSNVFTASNVTINDAGSGDGYFTFVTQLGADWDDETGMGLGVNDSHRYGAPNKDEPVTIDAEHEVVKYAANENASSAKSWKIGAGTYDFSVDFGTNKLTVKSSTASAIGAVNAEANGAAVYFNLQGARVANPTSGLYIKVQNGKSVKVAL